MRLPSRVFRVSEIYYLYTCNDIALRSIFRTRVRQGGAAKCKAMIDGTHALKVSREFTGDDFIKGPVLKDQGIDIRMDGKGRRVDTGFFDRLWRSMKYENIC